MKNRADLSLKVEGAMPFWKAISRRETSFNPFGWVPMALVVWFAIFGSYEVVERSFLSEANPTLLHTLHIIRGTGTSFLLAGLAAWYILRRKIPTSSSPHPASELRTVLTRSQEQEIVFQARWIIRLRWIAIVGVVLTTLLCWGLVGAISGFSALALLLTSFIMVVYNGVFSAFPDREFARFRAAFAQVFLDLVALTLMIYFTGGVANPFSSFYIFHIVIAGILLKKKETYWVTAVACVLYCGMALFQQSGLLSIYPLPIDSSAVTVPSGRSAWLLLLGQVVGFVASASCTAYFTTTIMEKLRKRSQEILEADEILSQERSKTDNILRSVGAGLLILDADDKIVWSNEIAQKWFGESLVGQMCYGQLWEAQEECETCPARRTRESGATVTSERSSVLGGTRKIFVTTTSPIFDSRGRVHRVLALLQDVTPVRKMENHLVQAGKMLTVGELSAGIAHEISTPLAIVASSAEILSDTLSRSSSPSSVENSQTEKHLKRIEENVYRCKDIIQTLLTFGRRDEEGFREADLTEILDDTVQLVEGSARGKDREIRRRYGAGFYSLPHSKPRQIQHVFLNVLLNGLDAIPPGGAVDLSCRTVGAGIEVTFQDSGFGIDTEDLDRLFEPFFTTKPAGVGTGLGLYLSKQIVDSLHGSISVESDRGRGTIFRVWLPFDSRLSEKMGSISPQPMPTHMA